MEEMIEVYGKGPIACSVCTNITDMDKLTKRLNEENPLEDDFSWKLSKDKTFATGQPNPCPCSRTPNTHKHYLFVC